MIVAVFYPIVNIISLYYVFENGKYTTFKLEQVLSLLRNT
jgi:hypothetical protein